MINKYPLWKYLLIVAALLAGVVYSIPNLYGEDPALQVSAGARNLTIDESTRERVKLALEQAGIAPSAVELSPERLLVRFANTDDQLKAQALVKDLLGRTYVVALNLAPRTPGWLLSINALPMYLGLDLRGGVHFLMEVDVTAAVRQAEERYVNNFRSLLRDKKVRYNRIGRGAESAAAAGVEIVFASAEARAEGRQTIEREFPGLVLDESEAEGGYLLLVTLSETERTEVRKLAVGQNITTLRNRVDELGVAEPLIQQQGADRIVVQLPGVQDTARAKEILGATATLEFRLADETNNAEEAATSGRVPPGLKLYPQRDGGHALLRNQVMLTGDYIIDAASGIDSQSGGPAVFITLDSKGASLFSKVTGENVKKLMAVVFIERKTETRIENGEPVKTSYTVEEVINIARIQEQLSKRFQITGLDSTKEAHNLALLLRAGALAAPIEIVEERTVGPSLGAENIVKGFRAMLIGFAVIVLFMLAYYNVFGAIASFALFINMLFMIAILSILQATLTLPGIAGIALTLGMAIDANVLIYERVREELRNGNSIQAAIHAGYERAWGTILDSNITTLIAGFALFLLGSGPVRGFAVVLCIGILTSMFSAVVVSRGVVNLFFGQRKLAKLPIG